MKKKLLVLITAVILAVSICAFSACDPSQSDIAGSCTVAVQNADGSTFSAYRVDFADIENISFQTRLSDVLKHLATAENLHLVYEDSAFGMFITEIGGVKNGTDGYIMFYLDQNDYKSFDQYATELKYTDEVTVFTSAVGVGGIPLNDGATYLFKLN